jgi:hypothetical protein
MDLANKLKNQATYIGSLETEVQYQRNMTKQLTAQIQRVRELHPPQDAGDPEGFLWCVPCREMYPCPTIKVLDGEQ